jgi:hypothetical protein
MNRVWMNRHRIGTEQAQIRDENAGSVSAGWRVEASPPMGGAVGWSVA